MAFGIIIITALVAFEIFNYSTTDFALHDLLGDLNFAGLRWSTILAIAFCGIDFAGIARIFTPEEGAQEPSEVWYLFGAWLLAATMNAMLTWWGVSIAILGHETLGNAVVDRQTLLKMVPIFVATLVWLSRVLLIGSFSIAGDRLFSQAEKPVLDQVSRSQKSTRPSVNRRGGPRPQPKPQPAFRAAHPRTQSNAGRSQLAEAGEPRQVHRPEPTYHPVSMSESGTSSTTNRAKRF
jgi:hypothetical protein